MLFLDDYIYIYINKCTVTDTKASYMVTYQRFLRLVKVSHISLGYHHRSSKGNKEIYTLFCAFLFPGQTQWITLLPLSISSSSVTALRGQWENCSRRAIVVSCSHPDPDRSGRALLTSPGLTAACTGHCVAAPRAPPRPGAASSKEFREAEV